MLRVLDLFSGIGGFSLGLERTGGFRTVAFCEIEQFCQRVLAKHWPGVPCYNDVRTLTADDLAADGLDRVDVVCGGFPCQDISSAGRGAGLDGNRSGLWFEMLRIVTENRPQFVVIENSPVLRSRGLETVLSGLAAIGYDAEWHCIPAAAIGAPHRRDRVWVVAYTTIPGRQAGACSKAGPARPEGLLQPVGLGGEVAGPIISGDTFRPSTAPGFKPILGGSDARLPGRVDADMARRLWERGVSRTVPTGATNRVPRVRHLGNAVVPQVVERIGRAILAHRAAA